MNVVFFKFDHADSDTAETELAQMVKDMGDISILHLTHTATADPDTGVIMHLITIWYIEV